MLALCFFALYRSPDLQDVGRTLWQLGLFTVSIVGTAGFGHFFLDAFDVEEDRLAGKANLWADAAPWKRAAALLGLLAASWAPWLSLPGGSISLSAVAMEYALFVAYAVPPLRLKTRGLPGIIVDASYAHVLPVLLSFFLFSTIARVHISAVFFSTLGVWSMMVGMRHLMHHQAVEAREDRAAGTQTFGVRRGAARTFEIIVRLLIPIELASLAGVLAYISVSVPLAGAIFVMYCVFEIFRFRMLWLRRISDFRSLNVADKATLVGTLGLSQFYELWLPVVMLAALTSRSRPYAILAIIYLLLFRNGFGELLRRDVPLLRSWVRSRRGHGQTTLEAA
jgi:UbiA prenyltransferase family.